MKTVFRILQSIPIRSGIFNIHILIIHVSFFLFQCGNIQEILWRDSKSLSENYASQIFFAVSPFVSLYYEPSSFQARYVILRSQFGKNEMIQGNLKYLELSRKSEQLGKILLEVSEWKGTTAQNPNDNRKIEFSPAFIIKRLETSSNKSESPALETRKEVLNDVKKEFVVSDEGRVREAEEIRIVPGIGTLKWKHSPRGILFKVMQTEFISANGTTTSSRDYDYDSLEYPPAIRLTGMIPVLPLRKTEVSTEYYCLDFPSEIDLTILKENEVKKSVSFYDLAVNKPFTTTANFKNYPIIRISNEKSQSP
ncbi:LIC_13346 family putative lipoprotein [Leptospira borgpetersenii]|uniref:LIC_13346 family putative lipoprotein n=1 Tax=Leptospira borgpetersenii TaxID=174 RepID=UPI0018802C4E|nr:hypothetical protein [Leptospira borgpetersenii]MBE8363843.1 hypothetical protein [Leptospira borgpetersenii serovar Balcanica]MBE8368086.1 hypothetical protein [Leptospira borgpetersenii serovar Balcanica]MBE8422867.1 hypothetical protein [Leptospira borgpetersenii serovar Balcanica]MBF3349154.1 hypothetical protein [Leptospira borgpetersenii serovar Balcanica]